MGPRGGEFPLSECRQDRLNPALERRKIPLGDLPHRGEIHPHVLVNEHVAQARDATPWNLRVRLPEGVLNVLYGLTDDLELPNHGILPVRGGEEGIASDGDIRLDLERGVQDVAKVDGVAIHKGTASRITASRM